MTTPLLQALSENFAALPAALIDAAQLGDSRREQLQAALTAGLPGGRAERWRQTSLRALERRRFAAPLELPAVDPACLPPIPGPRLVFVNGQYSAALSQPPDAVDGVSVLPLSHVLSTAPAAQLSFLAQRFHAADETFARLNAALALDGVVVRVAAGVRCEAALHLVMIGTPGASELAVHVRHRIELADDAALTLVEHHIGAAPQANLINSLTQVQLGARAHLRQVRVQREDAAASLFARTDATLAADAQYQRLDLELGAALSRHELNVAMQGRGARVRSNGLLLADGRRHLDTRLAIDHAAADTRCDLLWRGLATDRGRAVFHGGIRIQAGADGSAAHLSNKNLLLSAQAEIDTQPVLEIHADEVQASHGATVGHLDERALFYLRSRGVPAAQARSLLILAFCRVVLDDGDALALRDHLDALLTERLPVVSA